MFKKSNHNYQDFVSKSNDHLESLPDRLPKHLFSLENPLPHPPGIYLTPLNVADKCNLNVYLQVTEVEKQKDLWEGGVVSRTQMSFAEQKCH